MVEPIIWFVIGLVALIGGAEILVRCVSKLAIISGIPKLVIGLTVVAFGTSAPELAVSIQAGIDGQTDLMLGNIVGSNITNTLLILGISALFIPLKVNKNLIKWDVPIMIGITLIVYLMALSGSISFFECIILSLILLGYLIYLARRRGTADPGTVVEVERSFTVIALNLIGTVAGFAALILGARWLIGSALIFAEMAGVSELTIGLTVVAIGTSLPEIVISLAAAMKGERDIAVGSVIGSNILNFLAVLGVSGLFIPGAIPVQDVLVSFDLLVLIGASVLCVPIFYTGHKIVRWEGLLLLFLYFSYLFYLYLVSADHNFLSVFVNMMLYFIIPVFTVTIIFYSVMEAKKRYRFRNFNHTNQHE